MRIIPQRSTAYLTIEFRDINGISQPPSSAVYRIDDLTSGEVIREDTQFIVASDGFHIITLTKDDNDIVNNANFRESRRLSVIGFYNTDDDEVAGVFDYAIDRVFIQGNSIMQLIQ